MPRPGAKRLGMIFAFSFAFGLCSASEQGLEDRSVLLQDTVDIRRPQDAFDTRRADPVVAALDPFTAVHYTSVNKLPGLGGKVWGEDTQKGDGAVLISDGLKTQSYGAAGGTNKERGTSHGAYGGVSNDNPYQPAVTGAWKSGPGYVKIAHSQPSPIGGLDAVSTVHKFGKGPSSPLQLQTQVAEGAQPPVEASLADILQQPFMADTMTVAVRKPDAPRRAAWGKDDVMGSAGKFISVGGFKDGIGGTGGYAGADQSYHFVYGTGPWIHEAAGEPLKGGGTIGTVAGKPGEVDINHVQPKPGGGAKVTSLKSHTFDVDQPELERILYALKQQNR